MSIELEKRAEKVGIVLEKRGVTSAPSVRVGAAFDVSGSAQGFYTSGVMQETIDRLLGVALKFDDNGEIDAWMFHHSVTELPTITSKDEGTYVRNVILRQSNLWGGTSYAPPLQEAIDNYFPTKTATVTSKTEEKSGGLFGLFGRKKEAVTVTEVPVADNTPKQPAMLLFITDGANGDRAEAARLLRNAAANSPMYFNFVGIGPESYFDFIQEMADELPNVGFVSMASLNVSDEELYDQLMSQEFCDWIKKL